MLRITLLVLQLYFIYYNTGCSKKIEDIPTCLNDTDCNELMDHDVYPNTTTIESNVKDVQRTTENIYLTSDATDVSDVTDVPVILTIVTTVSPRNITRDNKTTQYAAQKRISSICECDLTIFSCDINCCCDADCKEYQLEVFSHCDEHQADLYDSRYCYNKNFIERNNTPFILERLAGNLFCILYDNLPPTYSSNNDLTIKTEVDFKAAIAGNKFRWELEQTPNVIEFNLSTAYKDGDVMWKVYKYNIKPIELLQSGFSGTCTFKKVLKYLRTWKDSCLQNDLTNANRFLFVETYNNFTILASPTLFNATYMIEQACPRNVCLSTISHYCDSTWSNCTDKSELGACLNGTCHNVVRAIKYTIVHNGSMGISSVHMYFNLVNVSYNFYQHFEVTYEWINVSRDDSFTLSGNPGYTFGKPIIIGTLKINMTSEMQTQYISFNKTDAFLTLPRAQKGGECSTARRHVIAFGENIKLKCSVSLKTGNFSASSCKELQDSIMQFILRDSLDNITHADQYPAYVSKLGNFTRNSTSEWKKIFLDRIPQSIITGWTTYDRLHCSGLITTAQLDILYSVLPKPETLTNYNILGIGITFSEERDLSWPKCTLLNCTDTLKTSVASYVMFHDISRPSKYYFVGGLNLDISVPYDFFYPFLSDANLIAPVSTKIVIVATMMVYVSTIINTV